MSTYRDVILGRWKSAHDDVPHLKTAKLAIEHSLTLNDEIRAQHAKVSNDTKLTGLGRQDAIRKYIAGDAAVGLHVANARVERMRANVQAWRARLKTPPIDKSDLSAAVLRSEARTMLRSASNGSRAKLLLSEDADPTLLAAVLEGPNAMTGIDDDMRQMIETKVIERAFPGQLTAIEEAEEVVALTNAALRITVDTARAAADFPDQRTLESFVKESVGAKGAYLDRTVEQSFSSFGNPADLT